LSSRDPLTGPDPLAGRDPRPARDSWPGRDPLSGGDPLAGRDPYGAADPRYSEPVSRERLDPYPAGDGYPPRAPQPSREGHPEQNGYRRSDAYDQPGRGGPPDRGALDHGALDHGAPGYGPRGYLDEPDPYRPGSLGGAEPGPADSGPFRWRPAPDASGPQALPELPGYGDEADHDRPGPDPRDWDASAEPGGRAGRRRSGGSPAGFDEPGADPRREEPWPYDGDEPPDWDEPPSGGGLIPGFGDGQDSRRGRGGRPRRRVTRMAAPVVAPIVVLVVLAALALGGYKLYQHFQSADYSGPGTGRVMVQVLPGDTAESLAPRLVKLGVVASTGSFVSAVKASSDPTGLEPGFFLLHKHMNSALAYKLLLNPSSRIQTDVTIPEGLRLTSILALLEKKTGQPASAFTKALKDPAALGLPSYANGNAEGFLFPATYDFNPGTSAQSMLQAMVTRFNQEAASINLPAKAKAAQLTENQVITVASILEAEAGNPKYYGQVAEVIYNRLNTGMFLGLDSTVNYALHRFGVSLTQSQLHVNSPYNTVTHKGLPPGPIDSPGNAAILAALHPDHGDLLYFVTVNLKTGLTLFTNSPSQFQQFVNECQQNHAC